MLRLTYVHFERRKFLKQLCADFRIQLGRRHGIFLVGTVRIHLKRALSRGDDLRRFKDAVKII